MRYRSAFQFLGLPLVDVAFGPSSGQGSVEAHPSRGRARGWIAVGDVAHGVLFACGGISVGAVSIGGVAFGAVSLGGVALGAISVGGLALGYSSLGGVALALDTARGGIALAFEYALGPISIANHVTDDAAREHFSNGPWLGATRALLGNGRAILVLGVVASIAFGLAQRRIKSSPPTDVGT